MESWKQSGLGLLFLFAAILAGGGLQQWTLDHPPAIGTGGASNVTTAPAMPCAVAQDICDLAASVETDLRAGDYRKITSIVDLQVTLRMAVQAFVPNGTPRLVSIGCPFGATSSSCDGSFSLIFTTLQPQDDWTGTEGILVLLYDRRPTGIAVASTLVDVNGLVQRDARRVALAGGFAQSPCNLSGIAPDQGPTGCARSEFQPFGTHGPFIPAEVTVEQPFTVLSPDPPPLDSLLYIATGCWACEGFDTGIERVITDPDGNVSVERAADPPLQPGEMVTTYSATPNASLLVASTCLATSCGPLGPGSADARSRLFASVDGGFSWQELASYPGYMLVYGVAADGRIVISRNFGAGDPTTWPTTWELLPGRTQLIPPAEVAAPARPLLIHGDIAWLPFNPALLNSAKIAGIKLPLTPADELTWLFPFDDGSLLISWDTYPSGHGGARHVFAGRVSSEGLFEWKRELDPASQFSVSGQLTESLLLGNVETPQYGRLPALIDLDSASIQPVGAPFGQRPLVGRNTFLAAVAGPFDRVSRLGSCADVRQSPSNTAKSFGCFKDGVFLQDLGDVTTADGTAWVHVITPANEEGWADSRFLVQ